MTRLHYASTADANMLYLVGHKINDPFFFLEHDGVKRIFLGSTDLEAYRENTDGGVEAVAVGPLASQAAQQEGDRVGNLAYVILKEYGLENEEVLVPSNFPIAVADALREKISRLIAIPDWAPERRQKSSEEIAYIEENTEYTKEAFVFVESVLRESEIVGDTLRYRGHLLTSEFLKREVSRVLLGHDLVSPEGMIISCGTHASMPHHEGQGPLQPGKTIVVDMFPQSTSNQYFADMTRTYIKGTPLYKETERMYEAVRAAQENAMKALRPDVELKMPYEISAGIIERAGFDVGEKGYIHSLGHGLGVAVHEQPNMSPKSEGVLRVGDVVTVEPGLYYAEWGGVRLEDTVVITEDGYRNLTNYPKELCIL